MTESRIAFRISQRYPAAIRFMGLLFATLGLATPGCGDSQETSTTAENEPHVHRTTEGDTWHTSYQEALAEAQARDLPVLIDFSGLEWCEPCQVLRADVFDSKAFGTWAHDRCVLLEIDVPAPGKPRDVATAELIEKYEVTTYPTVWFVKPSGEALGRIPVSFKEPESWLDAANTILAD